MRKPQHVWWKEIDNSYHPFVTCLKNKPHQVSEIPPEILAAQTNKPHKFEFKDHKIQEKTSSLPNPYQAEIEAFDNSVDNLKFDL